MISSPHETRVIAEALLDELVRPAVDEEIVVTKVWEYPACWVVGYNTRAHVETGSMSHALVGAGPVIINRRTGKARLGSSALPIEAQLDSA